MRPIRLAYLVSHPIQYQAPLLRRVALEPGIALTVFFGSDFSVRGYRDEGFGVDVEWDIPLVEGYRHEFLPTLRDNGTNGTFSPIARGLIQRLDGFDALWVHGYATALALHGIVAANFLGIPVLLRSDSTLHDRPRSTLKRTAKELFFAALQPIIAAILTTGTLNDAYWRSYFGDEIPLILMPYAVDNAWFERQTKAASLRRHELQTELGLDPKRPVILFASKLQTRKHCDDLIAAYATLSPDGQADPDPYLVIVGDGEERAALERQAAETGFGSIRFCGFRNQSQMPRFFDLATVFVLPARHEPWGLIVNEAMNAALPVIVSDDIGCQPDLVTDGVEGFVYPVCNIAALAAALRRILAPGVAATMGRNALTRIDQWSFEQDIEALHQALRTIANPGAPCLDAETWASTKPGHQVVE